MSGKVPGKILPVGPLKPQGDPTTVSVIIVNWNAKETILACLDSVEETQKELEPKGIELEIFIVDNASTDGSVEAIREQYPHLDLQANKRNAGFAAANNQAFKKCTGRWVLLLNPDTVLNADAIVGMVDHLKENEDVGAVGVSLVDQKGKTQNAHDNFPSVLTELFSKHVLRLVMPWRFPSKRFQSKKPFDSQVIIGACLMLKAEVLWRVDGFDEEFFLFVEEADLCRRIWNAGFRVVMLPQYQIVHGLHPSKAKAPTWASLEGYRSTALFVAKHGSPGLAKFFQILRGTKLCLINVPLSVLGVALTLGLDKRYIRRLKIRSRLSYWYLKGCPKSWGMRTVSPIIGFERELESPQSTGEAPSFDGGHALLPEGATQDFSNYLRDPGVYWSKQKQQAEKIVYTQLLHDEALGGESRCSIFEVQWEEPLDLIWNSHDSKNQKRGSLQMIAVRYELKNEDPSELPKGIHEFELAIELHDKGHPFLKPLGASTRELSSDGSHGDYRVFYYLPPEFKVFEDFHTIKDLLLSDKTELRNSYRGARRWPGMPVQAARYAQPAEIPLEQQEEPA